MELSKLRMGTDFPTNPQRWAWVEMPEKGSDYTIVFIAPGAKYLSTVEDVERFSLCFVFLPATRIVYN